MKKYLVLFALVLFIAGCTKDTPVEAGDYSTSSVSEATYSTNSMLNTTTSLMKAGQLVADSGGCVHDSLRNMHMLDSLKVYLSLTDDQFNSLQQIGTALFTKLTDIRAQVMAHTITRDSSKTLVNAARAEFVTAVKAILTTDQQTLFDTWLTLFWNDPKPGHGGHGGGHEHGGPHSGHHGGGN